MSIAELLSSINREDRGVPFAVAKALPQIERVIRAVLPRMLKGGRLFYVGAGTSGRLGIVDASECPPTFGVKPNPIIALIAGGKPAVYKAVEFAEDSFEQGWTDLKAFQLKAEDSVLGLAASGKTTYVLGAVQQARQFGLLTACLTCNLATPLAEAVELPIEILVGAEFLTGSTRMKAGTAQKLTLNMISTSLMIKLGHVKGNKMVDMQLSNQKLIRRGTQMLQELLNITDEEAAKTLLLEAGSVRKALELYNPN